MTRLREIIWLAKDASALFEDLGDARGRAVSLMTLTRAHLTRAQEPDAPMAAVKPIKECVKGPLATQASQTTACAFLSKCCRASFCCAGWCGETFGTPSIQAIVA